MRSELLFCSPFFYRTARNSQGSCTSPHLRLSVFRTINLFPKVRIARFFRFFGIDSSGLHVAENGVSVVRNNTITKYIQECVGYQGEQESHNRSQGLMRGKDMSRDQGRAESW